MFHHILATRPNFTKSLPVIEEMRKIGLQSKIIHTGQHYDYKMSDIFFDELEIPKPDYFLKCSGGDQIETITKTMHALEDLWKKDPPTAVIIYGDVNGTLAAGIVAKRMGFKLIHIEAGCRSGDIKMPEEQNRILVDSISDLLFCIDDKAQATLITEGKYAKAYLFGNTSIDNLLQNKKHIRPIDGDYYLLTLHRPFNVDKDEVLFPILKKMNGLHYKVKFPIHPRIKERAERICKEFQLSNIELIGPQSYFEFLSLLKSSKGIVTDSGGVQTEASVLNVRAVTLRPTTEHEPSITYGTNTLCNDIDRIQEILDTPKQTVPCRYWDGTASVNIAQIIKEKL